MPSLVINREGSVTGLILRSGGILVDTHGVECCDCGPPPVGQCPVCGLPPWLSSYVGSQFLTISTTGDNGEDATYVVNLTGGFFDRSGGLCRYVGPIDRFGWNSIVIQRNGEDSRTEGVNQKSFSCNDGIPDDFWQYGGSEFVGFDSLPIEDSVRTLSYEFRAPANEDQEGPSDFAGDLTAHNIEVRSLVTGLIEVTSATLTIVMA